MDGHHASPETLDDNVEVNVATDDASGWTPLHNAVTMLIDDDKTKVTTKVDGKLPSSTQRWWNEIKNQIADGADCNKSDPKGMSPILNLANAEMWEYCRLLIEMGANVNGLSEDQKDCLLCHIASSSDLEISNDTEEKIQSVLYKTIRLDNIDLFKFIMKNWRTNYTHDKRLLIRIDETLSDVYEDLLFKGVPLSLTMQFIIEDILLNSRFSTTENEETKIGAVTVDEVKARAALICENIQEMREIFCNFDLVDGLDGEFICRARFIAQNIHILKRQLKSTYNKLPWEEMEFCIATFISSRVRPQEFNAVVFIVLDKDKLLQHMDNFERALTTEMLSINDQNINSILPKSNRTDCEILVTKAYENFSELYKDHEMIRTMSSLKRIESCIHLALEMDLESRKDVGKLVIERTLQVIGEYLKNTLESPNAPDSVQYMLLCSAPRNLRQIITNLRDFLSHAYWLNNRITLEESKGPEYFTKIHNDLKKIATEIGCILCDRKKKAFNIFMMKISDCKGEKEFIKLRRTLEKLNFEEIKLEVNNTIEIDTITSLVDQLSDEIKEQTDEQKASFKEIKEILVKQKSKLMDVQLNLTAVLQNMHLLPKEHECNFFKKAKNMAKCIAPITELENEPIRNLLDPLQKIVKCSDCNNKTIMLCQRIVFFVTYYSTKICAIDEYKGTFERNTKDMNQEMAALDVIENGLEELICGLIDKQKQAVRQDWKNKVELNECLMSAKHDLSLKDKCETLFAALKPTKKQKMKFTMLLSTDDFDECKTLVDGMRGGYMDIVKSARKAIENDNPEDLRRTLAEFVKSKVKDFVMPDKLLFLKDYFHKRLEILQSLIDPLGGDRINFIDKCKEDRDLQVAVEMLVLDLLEILENLSLLADNRLFLDRSSPILIGKCLRNYLAHGDCFIDTLPFDTSLAIISRAFRLVDQGIEIVEGKNSLIGLQIKGDLPCCVERHSRLLACAVQQQALYLVAQEGNIEKFEDCITNGGEIKARNTQGWTVLDIAENSSDNRQLLQYIPDHNFDVNCGKFTRKIADDKGDTIRGVKNEMFNVFSNTKFTNWRNLAESNDAESKYDFWTLLFNSLVHGDCDYIETLLLNGAMVNAKKDDGTTPLHLAALVSNKDACASLIKHGANVDSQNVKGLTPLLRAVCSGDHDVVELLLENGANVNKSDIHRATALHYCACTEDNDETISLLLRRGAIVDARDEENETALHVAVEKGTLSVVQILLENGADVNAQTANGNTPLHLAAKIGHSSIVHLLLKKGASINALNKDGCPPLLMATVQGHGHIVSVLVKEGASIESSKKSLLHTAAIRGYKDIIEILLKCEADINGKGSQEVNQIITAPLEDDAAVAKVLENGAATSVVAVNCEKTQMRVPNVNAYENNCTPLYMALLSGQKDCVVTLLNHGANIESITETNMTALHLAALQGHRDIIELLLERGAKVEAVTSDKRTPLQVALICSQSNNATDDDLEHIVVALLKSGADVNRRHELGENKTPLHMAAKFGYRKVVAALLQYAADVDATDAYGYTPLFYASVLGHNDVVLELLKHKANVHAVFENGSTALHCAAHEGHAHVCSSLLGKGAAVNAVTQTGLSALHCAAYRDHAGVVAALLDANADCNARDNDLMTPLHMAADKNSGQVVQMLLERGAEVNGRNKNGNTPLHLAALEGHGDVVQALLAKGADVDARTNIYQTPLHLAAKMSRLEVLNAMLAQGPPNIDARDLDNLTPLHMAVISGRSKECIVALLDHGANIEAIGINNMTVLHLVAEYGHRDILAVLLERGANVKAVTSFGKTPFQVAIESGYRNIAADLDWFEKLIDSNEQGFIMHVKHETAS